MPGLTPDLPEHGWLDLYSLAGCKLPAVHAASEKTGGVHRTAAACGERAAHVQCYHKRAYVTFMLCVGVILKPAKPVSATPACISVWNSTKAIPGLASTMRTSAYLHVHR